MDDNIGEGDDSNEVDRNNPRRDLSRRQIMRAAATLAGVHTAVVAVQAQPVLAQPAQTTVARYILARLAERGVTALFGIPGLTCNELFKAAAAGSPLKLVVTTTDIGAGHAADGHARVRGMGAVACTYGVGTLALASVIAGAYAERSAVVVINGGPSDSDLQTQSQSGLLYEHSTGRPQSDLTIFQEITVFARRAATAAAVPAMVDAALTTAEIRQRPVYLEISHAIWNSPCAAPAGPLHPVRPVSGKEDVLAQDIAGRLAGASRPILLLGIEIRRNGQGDAVAALVRKLGIPWATTLLAKGVIDETTPGFVGIYGGAHSPPSVIKAVEQADVVLGLGCVLGVRYRQLATTLRPALLLAANEAVSFGTAAARPANLAALIAALRARPFVARPEWLASAALAGATYEARRRSITVHPTSPATGTLSFDQALSAVSQFLDEKYILMPDTSLSGYAIGDIPVAGADSFVCNGVWQSIGFAPGAAVGVGLGQARRPLVVCGDGGFQLSSASLSTMAMQNIRAIVLVLDNGLYGIEQWLAGGFYASPTGKPAPQFVLNRWNYEQLAQTMGFTLTFAAKSATELAVALAQAAAHSGPVLISARIDTRSLPAGLAAT